MLEILFWVVVVLLIYPLVLYPLSLLILDKFYKEDTIKNKDYITKVSFIVSAYNEEKVIKSKLENILEQDFPKDLLEIIIASDGSSDDTNIIVNEFIKNHQDYNISLLDVQGRRGKTHAQNEAVKIVSNDILVFSDSNSIWKEDALRLLVNRFQDQKLGYLSGKLQYINDNDNITSESESTYWNLDLKLRAIESKVSSTVGGNGAIYAIRKDAYVDLPDILSHDGFIPTKMVLKGLTAKFEPNAVAYEKAGETSEDEYKRKVRMQRGQPWKKYYDIQKFNIFKYGWFSYFYIGHKYLKYQLYLLHFILYILNYMLIENNIVYLVIFVLHSLFYILAIIGLITKSKKKLLYYPYYYTMTIVAQAHAVFNTLTGNSKSIWEKAESTR
jgi:cellulose synthase/poly-beta-1,6-N-acetylglucosamine synthase-like glycosyltransferase